MTRDVYALEFGASADTLGLLWVVLNCVSAAVTLGIGAQMSVLVCIRMHARVRACESSTGTYTHARAYNVCARASARGPTDQYTHSHAHTHFQAPLSTCAVEFKPTTRAGLVFGWCPAVWAGPQRQSRCGPRNGKLQTGTTRAAASQPPYTFSVSPRRRGRAM